MKKMKKTATILLISLSIITACNSGLNIDNEDSCKNALCKGKWDGSGMLPSGQMDNETLVFHSDGSVDYTHNDNSYRGTWRLGESKSETIQYSSEEGDVGNEIVRDLFITVASVPDNHFIMYIKTDKNNESHTGCIDGQHPGNGPQEQYKHEDDKGQIDE